MKDNKVAFPKYSHWTKYLNVKKYSPGSTDFPSHKDGIPSLLFLCCDIVQTTHPFWASVSLCSSFLGPSPKPHPPHTFFCPTPAGLTLPPHGCYACCSLCLLAFSQFSAHLASVVLQISIQASFPQGSLVAGIARSNASFKDHIALHLSLMQMYMHLGDDFIRVYLPQWTISSWEERLSVLITEPQEVEHSGGSINVCWVKE